MKKARIIAGIMSWNYTKKERERHWSVISPEGRQFGFTKWAAAVKFALGGWK